MNPKTVQEDKGLWRTMSTKTIKGRRFKGDIESKNYQEGRRGLWG